jgi:hypothetical protein
MPDNVSRRPGERRRVSRMKVWWGAIAMEILNLYREDSNPEATLLRRSGWPLGPIATRANEIYSITGLFRFTQPQHISHRARRDLQPSRDLVLAHSFQMEPFNLIGFSSGSCWSAKKLFPAFSLLPFQPGRVPLRWLAQIPQIGRSSRPWLYQWALLGRLIR